MKMRYILIIVVALIGFTACEEDNYKAPDVQLEGDLLYNGKKVATKRAQMRVELYEKGWDFEKEIPVLSNQDGHFSTILFKGDYKLFVKKDRGSFQNFTDTDTIHFKLDGYKKLDVEVKPFFYIEEPSFTVNGDMLQATFNFEKVVAEKEVGAVKLLVGKTTLVDEQYKVVEETLSEVTSMNNVVISADISSLKSKGYCYARIAVGTKGVNTYNYSFVKKIEL
ncbi:DUF3823 domain-containing protein [Prolixibacteraceae bacterium JC049]|nr:DUF3823 domain-containing protein [Prolixibacteraceae bacterium JC049]